MVDRMPPAEVPISADLVRALIREQHPDLADRPVEFVSEGWDSAVYRVGDDLAARMPRRRITAHRVPHELRWMPALAPRLPLPIPAPVRSGRPGCGYPWAWSITRWFDGATWAESTGVDTRAAAAALGGFVGALGGEAPEDAPANPYRGGPLTDRDRPLRERVALLGDRVDGAVVLDLWCDALDNEPATSRRWLHGDLHPANIVVHGGRIAAVVDWVDLSAGDRAYDLAAAWMCFGDADDRAAFVAATGVRDAAAWLRARGCALSHAIACLAGSADNARMHRIGENTLSAILDEA